MAKKSKTQRPDKIIPKGRPGGGARTTGIKGKYQSPPIAGTYQSPPTTKKGKPDPGGLKKTFGTRTEYGGKVKGPPKGSGGPPSVKAREDKAKSTREPPPVKYGEKKKSKKKKVGKDVTERLRKIIDKNSPLFKAARARAEREKRKK